jgi:hypothetical protein
MVTKSPGHDLSKTRASNLPTFRNVTDMLSSILPEYVRGTGLFETSRHGNLNPPRVSMPSDATRSFNGMVSVTGFRAKGRVLGKDGAFPMAE